MQADGRNDDGPSQDAPPHVVILTGRAGAGRTSGLCALEDLGFRTVDTPPLALTHSIATEHAETHGLRVAIGLDAQTVGYSEGAFEAVIDRLRNAFGRRLSVLFLDCDEEVLRRRYTETRRRHPLAPDESVEIGIARDRAAMASARDVADGLLDTSSMTLSDLKNALRSRFDPAGLAALATTITSFSYKRGAPMNADLVFDCRFLRNPHYEPNLRPKTGRSADVRAYIEDDPLYPAFFEQLTGLLELLLPAYQQEGKSYLGIAFGCTGGKHRSVALAETVGQHLRDKGWRIEITHREQRDDPSIDQRAVVSAETAEGAEGPATQVELG
ncbi:MAG: RNase adapter RapZ [Pseudomonadota bacterium]